MKLNMNFLHVFVLAVVQGLTELLPVSSSAHVIVIGRFLGWDPGSPEGTFLLVMLHTGTMFAVLVYFWRRWRDMFTETIGAGWRFVAFLLVATICTGVVGLALKTLIEKVLMSGDSKAEIEHLFRNLPLMAGALFAVGCLILCSGKRDHPMALTRPLTPRSAALIGIVQGLCLPFRGFSRSGATISTGLLIGIPKLRAEEFSFALAVILTPPVIAREFLRVAKATGGGMSGYLSLPVLLPGLVGMVFSFFAGLLALRWLSSWIEQGRWKIFGYYCIVFSFVVLIIHFTMG